MKIAVFARKDIDSAKKGKFLILDGISPSGSPVRVFLGNAQVEAFPLDVQAPSKEILEQVFAMLPKVEADFNDRGQVDAVYDAD